MKAPRNLNEPVRCRTSGFRNTRAPVRSSSAGEAISGVRTATGLIASLAAAMSAAVTASEFRSMLVIRLG